MGSALQQVEEEKPSVQIFPPSQQFPPSIFNLLSVLSNLFPDTLIKTQTILKTNNY